MSSRNIPASNHKPLYDTEPPHSFRRGDYRTIAGSFERNGGVIAVTLLTTSQAAERLGLSPRTLEEWRLRGGGPVFRKLGRRAVRYAETDLADFIEVSGRVNTGGASA
jgi:hypothetical protein